MCHGLSACMQPKLLDYLRIVISWFVRMYVAIILPFKRTNMPVSYFMDWPPLRRDNHRAYDS